MSSSMNDPDPFAPDEMAQHRRMNACPICFVEDCQEHGRQRDAGEEPLVEEENDEAEPTSGNHWEERADLE